MPRKRTASVGAPHLMLSGSNQCRSVPWPDITIPVTASSASLDRLKQRGLRIVLAMSHLTYGELLFERYLLSQGISFQHEPELPGIRQRIDYFVEHPEAGKVLLEVKDIENYVKGFGAVDMYGPIRSHIDYGRDKFRNTADYVCALVLAAPPGSFVELESPEIMLGAMYGDFGFRIPVDVDSGSADVSSISTEFIVGRGKMVRPHRLQNTRITALITVHDWNLWNFEMKKYLNTDDGRTRKERYSDLLNGVANLPDAEISHPGVTVWENATAVRKLPKDMFRGEMDARWEVSNAGQDLTFIGERRRNLKVDQRLR